MTTATLTSKGQITLPQTVRRTLGIDVGDKVDFVADKDGGFKVVALRKDVRELRGRFAGRNRRVPTLDDMRDAVETEAAARRSPRRSR